MLILDLLGMYFDATVVFVTSRTLLLKLAVAILCSFNVIRSVVSILVGFPFSSQRASS